jgi:hypothetical protein
VDFSSGVCCMRKLSHPILKEVLMDALMDWEFSDYQCQEDYDLANGITCFCNFS